MPKAENLKTVRTFFEKVLNAGDMGALERLARADVAVPQTGPGVARLRNLLSEMAGVFSDPEYKVIETFCDGERIAVRFSGKATHSGRYLGVPPTGRKLRLWGVMLFRFEAGAIAEFWSLIDAEGVLAQLRGP